MEDEVAPAPKTAQGTQEAAPTAIPETEAQQENDEGHSPAAAGSMGTLVIGRKEIPVAG